MIIWLNIGPGQGFHQLMKPLLVEKHSLYIGPKMRIRCLTESWTKFDVTFASHFKFDVLRPDEFDQILIEEVGIRAHPEFKVRQSQTFDRLVKFLARCRDKPVLFRPRFGQWYHFPVLHKALVK